jgi:hypothetical protein
MLSEKTNERLKVLLDKITKGPLSGGGDLQRQIFISTIDQILSEEKSEDHRRIIALQNELKILTESVKRMYTFLENLQKDTESEELVSLIERTKQFSNENSAISSDVI